jgi:hypothetical protein
VNLSLRFVSVAPSSLADSLPPKLRNVSAGYQGSLDDQCHRSDESGQIGVGSPRFLSGVRTAWRGSQSGAFSNRQPVGKIVRAITGRVRMTAPCAVVPASGPGKEQKDRAGDRSLHNASVPSAKRDTHPSLSATHSQWRRMALLARRAIPNPQNLTCFGVGPGPMQNVSRGAAKRGSCARKALSITVQGDLARQGKADSALPGTSVLDPLNDILSWPVLPASFLYSSLPSSSGSPGA